MLFCVYIGPSLINSHQPHVRYGGAGDTEKIWNNSFLWGRARVTARARSHAGQEFCFLPDLQLDLEHTSATMTLSPLRTLSSSEKAECSPFHLLHLAPRTAFGRQKILSESGWMNKQEKAEGGSKKESTLLGKEGQESTVSRGAPEIPEVDIKRGAGVGRMRRGWGEDSGGRGAWTKAKKQGRQGIIQEAQVDWFAKRVRQRRGLGMCRGVQDKEEVLKPLAAQTTGSLRLLAEHLGRS